MSAAAATQPQSSDEMGGGRVTPVTVSVRIIQPTVGPRLGSRTADETVEHLVRVPDHFTEYPCKRCDARLLTRAPRAFIVAHGGLVCPRCPASGVIATMAEETAIPGFTSGPAGGCPTCVELAAKGDIATSRNRSPISAKSLKSRRGISVTSESLQGLSRTGPFFKTSLRGGRPRLTAEERRLRARDRKRRQRGISVPVAAVPA